MDISKLTAKIDLSDGQWVDEIPGHPELRLKVRSLRYRPFLRQRDLLQIRSDVETDEGYDAAAVGLGGLLADHILVDWDGVTNDGKPVPYSAALAKKTLTALDPVGIGDNFRNAVQYAAQKVAADIATRTEEVAGN